MTADRRPALVIHPELPKDLSGIDQALSQGFKLHGFRSGGGLRVITLEKGRKSGGYGEHPNVDEALKHASEDFLAGGRPYEQTYGVIYTHYLTGSLEVTSELDGWLIQGHKVDARKTREGKIRVELTGLTHQETPQIVVEQVKTFKKPLLWFDRGFTFETSPFTYPSGEKGTGTKVVEIAEGKDKNRGFMFYIQKTGEGSNFEEALDDAFQASEVEIPDPKF